MSYTPLGQMEPRRIYRLKSKNLHIGAWDPATQSFIGISEDQGQPCLVSEPHYDASDAPGVAMPYGTLEDLYVPEDILLADRLPGIWCGENSHLEVEMSLARVYRHKEDGSRCHSPIRRHNVKLFEFLEPLDQRERASRYF